MIPTSRMRDESAAAKLMLTQIWIYPIKSLGGIFMQAANVAEKGFQFDRRWMLIDENDRFMTQRTYPSMALFKVTVDFTAGEPTFTIRKGNCSIDLSTSFDEATRIQSNVWNDAVVVNEVSNTHNEWFSDNLNIKCRLVFFPEKNERLVDPGFADINANVSLADGYPFLIIGEASLTDLNSRLEHPLPMDRFRPNLVFSGGQPYAEDSWKNFSIGNKKFSGTGPCARCVLTTVNQETAEKGREPLVTLAKYRKRNNNIYFGQNVIALDHGEIRNGDEIQLESA